MVKNCQSTPNQKINNELKNVGKKINKIGIWTKVRIICKVTLDGVCSMFCNVCIYLGLLIYYSIVLLTQTYVIELERMDDNHRNLNEKIRNIYLFWFDKVPLKHSLKLPKIE